MQRQRLLYYANLAVSPAAMFRQFGFSAHQGGILPWKKLNFAPSRIDPLHGLILFRRFAPAQGEGLQPRG